MLLGRRTLSVMAQQQQHQQPQPLQLDRSAFKQVIRVPAVRVPTKKCQELMQKLRGFTFDVPKTKCIVHDGDNKDMRLLLLKQELDTTALAPEVTSVLSSAGASLEVLHHDVTLDYSHLTADVVLKRLLPAGVEVPCSFESVGHIAHFNLRDEVLPYKHIIGQVVLDKNPSIKTVINKVGQINNEFRVFNMEVLAGEPSFETEVSQYGTRFRLDFSKVYWNSRLDAEHSRLVSLFGAGEVVADIMAGIGPFALPAGQKGCRVYANDLNPESAKYLNLNIQLNRVAEQVTPFNMDGRQFVRLLLATPGGPVDQLPPPAAADGAEAAPAQQQQVQQQMQQQQRHPQQDAQQQQQQVPLQQQQEPQQQQQQQQQRSEKQKQKPPKRKLVAEVPPSIPPGFRPPPGGVLFDHAVMNLPASAVEFLDAFNGAFDPATWQHRQLPMVHVYTFQKNETQGDVIARIEAALGGPLDEPAEIHSVRDVAPKKIMLCVSFRVPKAVAFAGRQQTGVQAVADGGVAGCVGAEADQQPAAKKPKV